MKKIEKKKKKTNRYDGWVKCCQNCKNRGKDQRECYNGKPYSECPAYRKESDGLLGF